jgi:hypothetical protein
VVTRRSCRVFAGKEIEMAIEDFARQWYQVKWKPGPGPGPIPLHAFKNNGTLLIAIRLTPVGGTPACDISWEDANENPCSIKALPFHKAQGTLQASDITVQFRTPAGGENPVRLEATLQIKNGQLIGTLGPRGDQDANTGTFIADANPPEEGKRPKQPRAQALALT